MTQADLTMSVRRVSDKASIVEIQGEVTGDAENQLMDTYTEAAAGDVGAIILDFSGMDYMNSSGIGLLVTLLIRANRQGKRLMALGLSEHYKQIFELTRLDEAIRIHDNEADALADAESA